MTASAVEFIVEEPSMEAFLRVVAPRIVPGTHTEIRNLASKGALLRNLPQRLKGYAPWVRSTGTRIVVVVDRDDDDCAVLKEQIVQMVEDQGLSVDGDDEPGDVLVRIACEELEAWYLGDVPALARAYPGVPQSLGDQRAFRDPDGIAGGTWEALQRVLQKAGHHRGGLKKIECAERMAEHMNIDDNRSPSFIAFRDGLRRLTGAL